MIEKLRQDLEKEEAFLRTHRVGADRPFEYGPATIGLVRSLIDVVEAQAKQIEELEQRIRGLEGRQA